MARVRLSIIIMMFIKDSLIKGKDLGKESTFLIKFINMLGNGNIIVFGGSENYLKIRKSSFRVIFRKDLSMAWVNIGTKMVIISREITSRTRREERENTVLIKVVYCNPSSIPTHLKYLKSI